MSDIQIEHIDPSKLVANSWNPNVVDPVNQDKIRASIEKDGFFKPVLVRENSVGNLEIIGGEHRVKAAIDMKLADVPVVNLGTVDDGQAKRIGQIDNARYGDDNLEALARLLADGEMGTAEELISVLPIDEAELADFMSHITMDDALKELENLDVESDLLDLDVPAPSKTHQILRFKVTMDDAEDISELITKTKHEQKFLEADDLTNAGDALVHLLWADDDENGNDERG